MLPTQLANAETRFWDKIAPKYAKKPIADPAAYEAKLSRVRAILRAEDRVLEIGCGTGSTALRLAPAVQAITATDISREMIAIAERKRADAGATNVTFRVSPAHERLDDATYDVVTAFSLLHLVDDLSAVLDAAFAQTKPGGFFASKTVCLGDAPVVLRLFVCSLRYLGLAPRVHMLTEVALQEALVAAGFTVLECRYFSKSRLNPFILAQRPA